MRRLLEHLTLLVVGCCATWLSPTPAAAQDGDLLEYQQEIGAAIGLDSYIGDACGGLMSHPGMAGTLLWRRVLNPRMSVKVNLGMGHISGNTHGRYLPTDPLSETPAGGLPTAEIHFSRNVLDAGAQFELNFLGYGMGAAYKGLHRWTPYMLFGAGFVVGMGGGGKAAGGLCLPMGFGVRYKVRPRLNAGFEWTVRFTTSDNLDDPGGKRLDAPYGITSGTFKNKDCHTMALIFLTYDISPKYRKCNN